VQPHSLRQRLALCSRILFASTEVMHTPRSDFPLHVDIKNIEQIRTKNEMLALAYANTLSIYLG